MHVSISLSSSSVSSMVQLIWNTATLLTVFSGKMKKLVIYLTLWVSPNSQEHICVKAVSHYASKALTEMDGDITAIPCCTETSRITLHKSSFLWLQIITGKYAQLGSPSVKQKEQKRSIKLFRVEHQLKMA